jgi:NMD protein affecting ribosome stability and mRNA decay
MTFCPKCGKRGIKGKFCKECAEKELNIDFKDIIIKKCIECSRFMIEHKWIDFKRPEDWIIKAAENRIRNPNRIAITITPLYETLKDKPGAEQDIELEIDAEGEQIVIPAKILFTYCDKCCKKGSQYFEGVLQLRDVNNEVIAYVKRDIAKNVSKGVHITTSSVQNDSADFVLTSSKYLRAIGKTLENKFNGELTETVRLFSRDHSTGKDIYRLTVLFRMHGHRPGNIIADKEGNKIKITKKTGKQVSGIDLQTGKRVFVKH